jgi:hypothetical protein
MKFPATHLSKPLHQLRRILFRELLRLIGGLREAVHQALSGRSAIRINPREDSIPKGRVGLALGTAEGIQ